MAKHCAEIAERRGWDLHIAPLPPLLHNRPEKIAALVRSTAHELLPRFDRVAIGFADCGTYGALDEVCEELGLTRLPGLHCYDVFGGASRMEAYFEQEPGTYVLTDFLARSFHRSVKVELGLDRHPELHETYFGHYRKAIWLAQDPDDGELARLASEAAAYLGVPLQVVRTGDRGLEQAMEQALS